MISDSDAMWAVVLFACVGFEIHRIIDLVEDREFSTWKGGLASMAFLVCFLGGLTRLGVF